MGVISPWFVGQTLPSWELTLVDTENAAVDLTGATMAVLITNAEGVQTTGAGTWDVTNPTAGIAIYAWAAADSATAGQCSLQVTATYPGGGTRDWLPIPWLVKPKGQL